ncbi:MAG TPA: GNAT family N-acetyltransferase [Jatrophihabitans sp.]|jgi:GNAT superfamily N-acetyltransferase
MRIAPEQGVGAAEALALYDAVGWTAYTRDPELLARALAGSHLVLTARTDTGELVGIARTVSDGASICYLQDLLVRPDQQRAGVGRVLLAEVLRRYADLRQVVLTTDADGPHEFYRALGFVPTGELGLVSYSRG